MKILLLNFNWEIFRLKFCSIGGYVSLAILIYSFASYSFKYKTINLSLSRRLKVYLVWLIIIVVFSINIGDKQADGKVDFNDFLAYLIIYYGIAIIGITNAIKRYNEKNKL